MSTSKQAVGNAEPPGEAFAGVGARAAAQHLWIRVGKHRAPRVTEGYPWGWVQPEQGCGHWDQRHNWQAMVRAIRALLGS